MPQRISCKYGSCCSKQNSTNRQVSGAPVVFFIKFPSAKKETQKCQRWVDACGRQDFTLNNVSRGTYICSRHFHDLRGPNEQYPDPIPLSSLSDPNFGFQPLLIQENVITSQPHEKPGKQNQDNQNVADDMYRQNKLDFKCLSPPSGWSLQILDQGVVFTQHRSGQIVLCCEFIRYEKKTGVPINEVSISALGKKISLDKIEKNLIIQTNLDVYNFLKKISYFKICPGNRDEDLVTLYKERRPNKHKTNSCYCRKLR